MNRLNYAHSAAELVQMYDAATSERGYVPDSFCAVPAGVDSRDDNLTQVTWRWNLPSLDES